MITLETLKQQLNDLNDQQQRDFTPSSVFTLLQQRSDFYDDVLIKLWQQFGLAERRELALVAVGGYGRKEMFPLSDLDILVLSVEPLDGETQQAVNQMVNLLWDCHLQVGIAVRTLAECVEHGKETLSIATNMLESRFLAGHMSLWTHLMQRLDEPDFWPIAPFFSAKMAEKAERYARYHHTGYNLEPDLKHSPGGLRDLHLLSWITLRYAKLRTLSELKENGILYGAEYQELCQAQHFLFSMRFALHLQLKRYDNRLRFDRQLLLSEMLGYSGEGNHRVERMMKGFFQATQSISQLTQLVLNHLEQSLIFPLQKNGEKQPLDNYFSLQDGDIHCEETAIFSREPQHILDLFYYLTQYPQASATPQTLRALRLALHSLKHPLSDLPQARTRFIQLFMQPNVVKRAIWPMHQLGVLSAYLPQWPAIAGLMQFDLFHIYTVDEHTVRVMLNLEQFLDTQYSEQFPLCCQLFPSLSAERHLIYLAALFHDIAKGREGDHATEGAEEMRRFALQHGFNAAETAFMVWLVENHLLMSITAQRRDIYDNEVIRRFARSVKSPTALSALTCLTIADIHGTHGTLWNDWKKTLFSQLYKFTQTQLSLGIEQGLDQQQQADENRQAAVEQLKFILDVQAQQLLNAFWQSCPPAYFIRNTPTQLVWHALHYMKQPHLPMVLVSNRYARGATEIFIHCYDQPQLFSRIAHTLSRKKINILDAQIMTAEKGLVLDSFIVTEQNGKALSAERVIDIQQTLVGVLNSAQPPVKILNKAAKNHTFQANTRLRFLEHDRAEYLSFELFTLDREGLLAHIADIFNQLGLNLVSAKITTVGERVEDFFVVSTTLETGLVKDLKQQLESRMLTTLGE